MVLVCPGCEAIHSEKEIYIPVDEGITSERRTNHCMFCGTGLLTKEYYRNKETKNNA